MHLDKWKETLDLIKEKFEVEDEGVLESDEHGGTTIEYIIFTGPIGKMKMEFISKPKVLEKNTTYSNRIGSDVTIDYVYSETEKSTQLLISRWSEADDDWLPVDSSNFQF
ncbi:MAG: hypothetical protein V1865_03225 [bacterium]